MAAREPFLLLWIRSHVLPSSREIINDKVAREARDVRERKKVEDARKKGNERERGRWTAAGGSLGAL